MKISSHLQLLFFILRFFLPIIFSLFNIPVNAQQSDYLIKTYSVDNGLAHPAVKCIARDSSGFLWISTFDGLSRFDGNEFVTYRHSPDDSTSLPPNDIHTLCVGRDNTLWILSSNVVRYDRASEKFVSYLAPEKSSIPEKILFGMTSDKKGNIWVFRTNELLRYDKEHDAFIPVPVKDHNGRVFELLDPYLMNFDEKGTGWMITSDGVDCFNVVVVENIKKLELWHAAHYGLAKNDFQPAFPVPLEFNFTSSETATFLASNYGLFCLDTSKKTFLPILSIPEKKKFKGCRSFSWSDKKNTIHNYIASKNVLLTILQQDFLQLEASFFDLDGSFWFSGLDKSRNWTGLRHVILLSKAFHHYFEEVNQQKTAIFSIYHDMKKEFWVGVRSKEYIFHLTKDGKPDHIFPLSRMIDSIQTIQNLPATHVRAINVDRLGNLWFGFLHTFLFFLNGSGHDFNQFLPEKNRNLIIGNKIDNRQILSLKNGMLLIGGDIGMYLINPQNMKITRKYNFDKSNSGMYAVFQDEQGFIWTGNGRTILRKFDQDLNPLDSVRLSHDYYNLEGIAGNADTLWIASMGGGLIRYITKTRSGKFYSTRDGLSHNYTYHLFPDSHNNLWISTNEGLSAFNPRTEIFTNFSETDGLRVKEFNSDAGFRAADGELFFGGIGGFVGFYPDSIYKMKKEAIGRLLITNVNVSGIKKLFLYPVYEMDTIVLGLGENNLQLTFACLDFNFPEKINYRYKLEGIDNKWSMTKSNNRHANYAGLTPGWYRFVVEVADKTGNWSVQRALTINIPAYLYQTFWFKLSMIFLVFSLVALILWMKYKQIRLINLKRQETLRMQSLQAQLNPHFIFNSLNSISFLISSQPQEVADQYVADFATLMRGFLDNSSRDFIVLCEEIESIEHYLELEHLRLHDKFDYRIEYPPGLETEAIEVVPSLVQPFIENSIWHGVGLLRERKGTIVVRFVQTSPRFILCTVEDDGIGRVKADLLKSLDYRKRQSKGVRLVLDRIKIINLLYKTDYQVVIEDLVPGAEETGTKVTIPLPVRVI